MVSLNQHARSRPGTICTPREGGLGLEVRVRLSVLGQIVLQYVWTSTSDRQTGESEAYLSRPSRRQRPLRNRPRSVLLAEILAARGSAE